MAYERSILDQTAISASTLLQQYRVVRVSAAGTGAPAVVHTTAASTAGNVRVFGVTQSAPTASTSSTGKTCSVRTVGVTKVEASSAAIAVGTWLRATSGAVGTTTRLGGTVRTTTDFKSKIGLAMTSAAAGTGRRLISMDLRL